MPKNILLPKIKPHQAAGLIIRIARNKTAAMTLLLEHVVRGYWLWTRGTVHHEKALQLAEKFDKLYAIGASPQQRTARKKKGLANAHLVMYPDDDAEHILWWLQVSPGRGDVNKREKLLDTRERHQHLCWTHQYYLVYRYKSRKRGSKYTWSWWLQARYKSDWESDLCTAASRHGRLDENGQAEEGLERVDDLVRKTQAVMRMPMFAGIRSQVTMILDRTHKIWSRSHVRPTPFSWPQKLPWLGERFAIYDDPPLFLSVLVSVMQRRHLTIVDR